jgi:hypothetical protein
MRPRFVCTVACAGLFSFSAQAAVPPPFSWATVPLFFHSTNESGLWSAPALERMRAFSIITMDKPQGMSNRSDGRPEEARALDAARAIRAAVGETPTILFYQNSMIDWPEYSTHAALVADPALRLQNASGRDALFKGMWLFDATTAAGRATPTRLCVALATADAGATYDGCFLDRGNVLGAFGPEASFTPAQTAAINAGHDTMLADVVSQLDGAGKLALLNNNGNFSLGSSIVRMVEDFAATETCISALRDFAAAGLSVEAHAGYFEDGTDKFCASPPVNSLAAFLIGAGAGAYYACAPGWSSDPRWPAVADPWLDPLPQYARPLGAPLADASRSPAGMWTRRFASGTNVSFNAKTGNGRIAWGDGTIDLGKNTGVQPDACKWW